MRLSPPLGLFLALSATSIAQAGALLVQVQGMTCDGCEGTVRQGLARVAGVSGAGASHAQGRACVEFAGEAPSLEALQAAVGGGFPLVQPQALERCPAELLRSAPRSAWEGVAGLDAQVISRGEEVDIKAHVAAGRYTLVDFGAPWCGPCHAAAERLKAELARQPLLSVRAVELVGADAYASFALPAAKQHLTMAPGIPWFQLWSPRRRLLYEGDDLDQALKIIESELSKGR